MSKKARIILTTVLLAMVVIGGTLAYLTYQEGALNRLQVSQNTIEITEEFDPPETPTQHMEYLKSVRIKNTGNTQAFVRVHVDVSKSAVAGVTKFMTSAPGAETPVWVDANDFKDNLPDGWEYVSAEDIGEPDAANGFDGYYYYTQPVKAGEYTPYLFYKVKTDFANESDVTGYDIYVTAESIQNGDKNNGAPMSNYQDAWKQFLENDE